MTSSPFPNGVKVRVELEEGLLKCSARRGNDEGGLVFSAAKWRDV